MYHGYEWYGRTLEVREVCAPFFTCLRRIRVIHMYSIFRIDTRVSLDQVLSVEDSEVDLAVSVADFGVQDSVVVIVVGSIVVQEVVHLIKTYMPIILVQMLRVVLVQHSMAAGVMEEVTMVEITMPSLANK